MYKKFYCLRCKNKNVIEYEDAIVCPTCELEFDKEDLLLFDDDVVLSYEEKKEAVRNYEGDIIRDLFY